MDGPHGIICITDLSATLVVPYHGANPEGLLLRGHIAPIPSPAFPPRFTRHSLLSPRSLRDTTILPDTNIPNSEMALRLP